jgi:hypothetical protein
MSTARRQLLAYTFPPGSRFEGHLVGALERIESGGAMRILDALFVGRDEPSGELVAVSMSTDGAAGMVGRLIGFRLDPAARKSATTRALDGPAAELVQTIAAQLAPGEARAAILVEHAWEGVLSDAIGRLGGTEAAAEFVQAGGLTELAERLTTL